MFKKGCSFAVRFRNKKTVQKFLKTLKKSFKNIIKISLRDKKRVSIFATA